MKTVPKKHENGHKLCDETGLPVLSLLESQFPNGGKAIAEQILASEEINKSKRGGL